jgi:hypothetical protein
MAAKIYCKKGKTMNDIKNEYSDFARAFTGFMGNIHSIG